MDKILWFVPCTAKSKEGCDKFDECERGEYYTKNSFRKELCISNDYNFYIELKKDIIVKPDD